MGKSSNKLARAGCHPWVQTLALHALIWIGVSCAAPSALCKESPDTNERIATIHRVRWIKDPAVGTPRIVSHKKIAIDGMAPGRPGKLRTASIPSMIAEGLPTPAAEWNEVESTSVDDIVSLLDQNKVAIDREKLREGIISSPGQVTPPGKETGNDAPDEVRTLISSGPPANRIDIVFMGDGYTREEREKFFSDMNRLVDDMFLGETFKSYLPVFNVHVVFRASEESGIPSGRPGKTAYGLYREGNTLRAIFPGDPASLRDSCGEAPDCDYPVVIANDPWYGGLGGEFAISTSSTQSGTVVLRHELGHNFGRVGEEYDGGGYFGANHAEDTSSLGWDHWVPGSTPRVREEPMVARFLAWPWHDFNNGPFEARFKSNGQYTKTTIRFSASGFGDPGALEVLLDDTPLRFKDLESGDRTFVDIEIPSGLASGDHVLVFRAVGGGTAERGQWLSSLTVHEYAADFRDEKDLVGAFPVFDSRRAVAGYRPTNESCLMRDMTHQKFCQVCQENNWMKFLDRIELIDEASLRKSEKGIVSAEVTTLELGQFRRLGEAPAGERVEIRWYADGNEVTEFRDISRWEAKSPIVASRLEVEVKLSTPEIREDRFGLTGQRMTVSQKQDQVARDP